MPHVACENHNQNKTSGTKWTDIYENLVYRGGYGNLPGLEQIAIFNDGNDCFLSWHSYAGNKQGSDHPCTDTRPIGYICIDPWADALEAPNIKHYGTSAMYDDIYKKCAEKKLYPLVTQNLMDVKKV